LPLFFPVFFILVPKLCLRASHDSAVVNPVKNIGVAAISARRESFRKSLFLVILRITENKDLRRLNHETPSNSVWERTSAKLCFALRQYRPRRQRNRVSLKCVP